MHYAQYHTISHGNNHTHTPIFTTAPCRLSDYERHLLTPSGFAPMHIWLPRHSMYLQGIQVGVKCSSVYNIEHTRVMCAQVLWHVT